MVVLYRVFGIDGHFIHFVVLNVMTFFSIVSFRVKQKIRRSFQITETGTDQPILTGGVV